MARRYYTPEEISARAERANADIEERNRLRRLSTQSEDRRAQQRLEESKQRISAKRRERDERVARQKAEINTQMQQQAAAAIEQQRQDLLHAWLLSGGTEAEFNEQWPTAKLEIISKAAQERNGEARRNHLDLFRGRI